MNKRLSSEVDQFDLREMVPSSFVSGVTSDSVTRPKAVTIVTRHDKQTTRNRWTRFYALPDDLHFLQNISTIHDRVLPYT